MKQNPIIAIAQIKYFDLDEKHNLEKIIYFIKKAKENNADIICFPETCILKDKWLEFNHYFMNEIKKECKKNNIWCIITEDFMIKGILHNISILIDRNGKIKGKYKKIKLYSERGVEAGKKVHIFKTDFAKIGIAICWDLAFPELFHKMKKAGVQIIFCPAQWAYEEKAYNSKHKKKELLLLKSLISSRAFENLVFIGFCSPYRNQKDLICYSAIVSPHQIIKEIFDKEGLIVSDIKLSELTKFKKLYPGK